MTKAKTIEKTTIPNVVDTLIEIAEKLRTINKDGYIRKSSWLADIKPWGFTGRLSKATVCSPFTGTVCGILFDPDWAKKDVEKDSFEPKYNKGTETLPHDFYTVHNDKDNPVGSLVKYNLGHRLKRIQDMRRGDIVAIDWLPIPKKKGDPSGGGHVVFCWDVHLNAKGDVDCFQMLGSHGSLSGNGYGVHIHGCSGERWLQGKPAKFNQPGTGNLAKADGKDKIFVNEPEIVEQGTWFALPGVALTEIDTSTFIKTPLRISATGSKVWPKTGNVVVGRFWYDVDPPKSYATKDGGGGAGGGSSGGSGGGMGAQAAKSGSGGSAPPPAKEKEKEKPGHADGPVTVIKKPDLKKDPDAVKKVEPKPAKQDPKKPLMMQKEVELAMHEFFLAKWLKSDPGSPDDLEDDKSKAAVKEFQKLFGLDDDGIVGKLTRAAIVKQLPACHQQQRAEELLGQLFRGGKISKDPGPPTGFNDDETKAAVEEFQGQSGLKKTGVPDADTLGSLETAVKLHAASGAKQGLNPRLEALYWLGNQTAPEGSARLRLHSEDLKEGSAVKVFLKNGEKGEEVEAKATIAAHAPQALAAIPMPASFPAGAVVFARVEATLDDGKKLELSTVAPLYVRGAAEGLEVFFNFHGKVGEGARERAYTYVAYKVTGKPQAWVVKGRFMTDVDGAPNCYHPDNLNVRTDYPNFDIMAHKGALDWRKNGGVPGNWFGVVTDDGKKTGRPIVQGSGDPFPGFYVASTSLVDKSKKSGDPRRYVDARQIPYVAFPYQIWAEGGGTRFERVTKGPTGRIGDLLTVVNPKADESHRFAHAIFADMGGQDDPHFGEGSPALGLKIQAHGLAEAGLFYVIYPHSGADQGTIPTADEIHEKGQKLFDEWGGMDEVNRVLALLPKK